MPEQASNRTTTIRPIIVLFIGILAVSTASILIRFSQADVPSIVIAAYRIGIATILLFPFAIKQYKEIKSFTHTTILFLILSGLFLALHFASWITSLEYTTVVSSVVLVATTPLWVALFSPFFLKERITVVLVAGLLLTLLGSFIVACSQICSLNNTGMECLLVESLAGGKSTWGNILALLGALFGAGYVLLGKKLRPRMSFVSYIFMVYSCAAIFLWGAVFVKGEQYYGFSFTSFFWLVCLGVIPQLIGHSSFNWALRYLPATYVSIALLGEPVGSTILSFLILKEPPTILELVGGGILLIGIAIASTNQNH